MLQDEPQEAFISQKANFRWKIIIIRITIFFPLSNLSIAYIHWVCFPFHYL